MGRSFIYTIEEDPKVLYELEGTTIDGAVINHDCPTCGREAGARCRTSGGKEVTPGKGHMPRRRRAIHHLLADRHGCLE